MHARTHMHAHTHTHTHTHSHIIKNKTNSNCTYVAYGVGLCVHVIEGELKLPADHVIKGIKARLKAGLQILVVYPSAVPKCELQIPSYSLSFLAHS